MNCLRLTLVRLLTVAAAALPCLGQPAAGPTEEEIQKITAAAPDKATAKPVRPRKVLVFSYNEGFRHTSIPYGAKAFEILGQKTGAFEVVHHSEDLSVLAPGKLAEFDAIIINNAYGYTLDEAQREALLGFVEGGKGLIGVHGAAANFEGWPEGTQLFTAKFRNHPWTPKDAWAVRNEDPTHPLNAAFGGEGFRVREEIYAFDDFHRERVRVLLSLDLSDPRTSQVPHPDPYVPISWIHTVGKGRVFFCSLGHVHDIFWTPAFLQHYLDGIQFALGDLQADPAPTHADRNWAFDALMADEGAQTRKLLDAVAEQVKAADQDRAQLAHIERQMLRVLQSAAGANVKRPVHKQLSGIATNASLPVVTPLLVDADLSHLARTAIERIGTPEAAAALRRTLPKVHGRLKAGVISSLANLGDRQAVDSLAPLVADGDAVVASSAIVALGRIGGPEAMEALRAAEVSHELQPALDDAVAICAAGLAAEGKSDEAEAAHLNLAETGRPLRARVVGLRGLVAIGSPRALELALAALQEDEPELQRAAARLAASVQDDAATPEFVKAYPTLPPAVQAVLLSALSERDDPAVMPVAVEALASDDALLRAVALRAVAAIGGPDAVEPLAGVGASGDRGAQRSAREHLARLPGANVARRIVGLAETGTPEVRAVLMRVLADRQAKSAIPMMLRAARDAEAEVAEEALSAVGRLGGAAEIAQLVEIVLARGEEGVRQAGQEALVAVAGRVGDPDQALRPMLEAFPNTPAQAKCALLPVFADVGGDAALQQLTRATRSDDAQVKRAAIIALGQRWEDARPLPTLLKIAKSDIEMALHVHALRGYLRLLALEATARPEETVAAVTEAMSIAKRPDEKKQALSVLRECRILPAAELAARHLGDETLMAEAADALLYLAAPQTSDGARLPAVKGPAVTTALDRLIATAAGDELKEKAKFVRSTMLPAPWEGQDVGSVRIVGMSACSEERFTVKASGADIWGQADAFHFVAQPLSGDCTITARVVSLENTDQWAKAGVMIRTSLKPESAHVFVCISPVGNCSLQWRAKAGVAAESVHPQPGQSPPSG